MYLWVILATFVVAILSYNLSVRPDTDRAFNETKAQTVIAKFKAQHNAFASFIYARRLSLTDAQIGGITTVKYCSGVGYANGEIIGNSCNGFTDPSITKEAVGNYMPIGYKAQTGIYSKVFCFKGEAEDYTKTCDADGVACCADTDAKVYVVSFQTIPSNWINHTTNTPTTDMQVSMAGTKGYGSTFGFNVREDTGQHISGGVIDNEKHLVYRPIYSAILSDPDYTSKCGDNKLCFIAIQQVQNREIDYQTQEEEE